MTTPTTHPPRSVLFEKDFSFWMHGRYAVPRMTMSLLVMSYLVVDGWLISQVFGSTALSSLNMVYPLISALMAIGVMVASGAATFAARHLGAKAFSTSDGALSLALLINFVMGALVGWTFWLHLPKVLALLNVQPAQYDWAMSYMEVFLFGAPIFLLSITIQSFLNVSGRAKAALAITLVSGGSNLALDVFFLYGLKTGIEGAAIATVLSWCVICVLGGLLLRQKHAPIRLHAAPMPWRHVGQMLKTGIFEFIANACGVVLLWIMNQAFLAHYGVSGVAALSVATFTTFVFNAIFHGFAEASGPIVAYKFGAQDRAGLQNTLKRGFSWTIVLALTSYAMAYLWGDAIIQSFANDNDFVVSLLTSVFPIFALTLLFGATNLYFTYVLASLKKGTLAGIFTFLRTFLLPLGGIALIPMWMPNNGLWMALPLAEAICASLVFLVTRLNRVTEKVLPVAPSA